MDKQKQIEEMAKDLYGIQTYAYMEIYPCRQKQPNEIVAEHLVRKGWIKLAENAVVLTQKELIEMQLKYYNGGEEYGVMKFAERLKLRLFEYMDNDVSYDEFCKANIVCGEIDEICKEIVEGKK